MSNLIKGQQSYGKRKKPRKTYTIEDEERVFALVRKIQKYAYETAQLSGQKCNWEDREELKWQITYDYDHNRLVPLHAKAIRSLGVVSFASKQDAVDAISAFRTELIWYFTEYLKKY